MLHSISNGILFVTVDTQGAELVSVRHGGRERIWQNESGDWPKHAPILFPVCGSCHVWKDGREYPIKKHGFASQSDFTLVEERADLLRFRLEDNEETRAVYPYAFRLDAVYRTEGDTLYASLTVKNTGSEPLPFAAGGHECHYLSEELSAYELVFSEEERFESLACGEYLGEVKANYGTGRILPIPMSDLQDKDSVIFRAIASRSLTLRKKGGEPVAFFHFPDFQNLLLWSPDGRHALCIEPWLNLPDTRDNTALPLQEKYGVITLQSEQELTLTRSIRYEK